MFFLHIYLKQPDGFESQWHNRGGPVQTEFIHFLVMLVGKSLGDHFCVTEEVELSCSCLLTTEMKQIISMSNLLGKCCLLGLFMKCLCRSFNSWISPFLLNIWLLPYLVSLLVGPFTNILLHVLEISTVHCCGFLHKWHLILFQLKLKYKIAGVTSPSAVLKLTLWTRSSLLIYLCQ